MSSRKKNGVESRFVIALLLGAALFAAGCCCTCPKYVGERVPEPVNVLVTWNRELGQLVVLPDPVHVCEGKQFVRWVVVGEGRDLTITFPAGSPFTPSTPEKPASERKEGPGTFFQTGVARPGTAGMHYKYVVSLRVPGVDKPVTLDPWVEVDH